MIADHPIVPHGISVALNAPAVFRFTGPGCPERHLNAARIMGADTTGVADEEAGELLAQQLTNLMKQIGLPNGLSGVGLTEDDIPALVAGTLPQHRVTKISPRPVDAEALEALFRNSMTLW